MQGQCSAPDQLNSNLKLQCPEGYAIGTVGARAGVEGKAFREARLVLCWVAGSPCEAPREALGHQTCVRPDPVLPERELRARMWVPHWWGGVDSHTGVQKS